MGLVLSKNEKDNFYIGKKYNVEYELGNGKLNTFSNILANVDGKYFWFMSEENGMDVIKQDRILTMTCIREKV